jgi:hypothetical protein
MGASSLLQKTQAIAAQFARKILSDSISSMVPNNIVNPITQKLNSSAFHELLSLFKKPVSGQLLAILVE